MCKENTQLRISPTDFIEEIKRKRLENVVQKRSMDMKSFDTPLTVLHQPSCATSVSEASLLPGKGTKVSGHIMFIYSCHDISTWWSGVWPHIFPPTPWLSHRSLSSPEILKIKVQLKTHLRTCVVLQTQLAFLEVAAEHLINHLLMLN